MNILCVCVCVCVCVCILFCTCFAVTCNFLDDGLTRSGGMIVTSELVGMWKEVFMAHVRTLFKNLFGQTVANYDTLQAGQPMDLPRFEPVTSVIQALLRQGIFSINFCGSCGVGVAMRSRMASHLSQV
jgi:hypothetical protein